MSPTLLITALLLAGGSRDPYADRPRHPLAPSLPLMTEAEEKRFEKTIERFVLYDTGKLTGADGKKALDDFNRLGPESFFSLVDGFNRAANIEASCPAVIIGKKIESILITTTDMELLLFARENLGAGVTAHRHKGMVQRLQTAALLRKGQVARLKLAPDNANAAAFAKSLSTMPLPELQKAAGKERGERFKAVLAEADKRPADQALPILAKAASNPDTEARKLGKALLTKQIDKQSATSLKALFKHDSAVVRAAAAQTAGAKLRWGDELIALLQDDAAAVRQSARRALVQLSGGSDFGPATDASFGDRATAVRRWREWWASSQ